MSRETLALEVWEFFKGDGHDGAFRAADWIIEREAAARAAGFAAAVKACAEACNKEKSDWADQDSPGWWAALNCHDACLAVTDPEAKPERKPLSPEEREARRPIPPGIAMDALHGTVHEPPEAKP